MVQQLGRVSPPGPLLQVSPDSEATQPCSWAITSLDSPAGSVTVVWVAGEVDLDTRPVLQAAFAVGLGQSQSSMVVDLSRLTFFGVCGLATLEQTAHAAAERGVRFAVSGGPALLERMWSLLPDTNPPARYPTVAEAILAVATDAAP